MSYWVAEVGTRGRHGGSDTVERTVLLILPDDLSSIAPVEIRELAKRYISMDNAYQDILRVTRPSVIQFTAHTQQVLIPVETK